MTLSAILPTARGATTFLWRHGRLPRLEGPQDYNEWRRSASNIPSVLQGDVYGMARRMNRRTTPACLNQIMAGDSRARTRTSVAFAAFRGPTE